MLKDIIKTNFIKNDTLEIGFYHNRGPSFIEIFNEKGESKYTLDFFASGTLSYINEYDNKRFKTSISLFSDGFTETIHSRIEYVFKLNKLRIINILTVDNFPDDILTYKKNIRFSFFLDKDGDLTTVKEYESNEEIKLKQRSI